MSLATLRTTQIDEQPETAPDHIVAYDVETSGIDVRHDQVLQFACVHADADLNLVESSSLEVRRLPYVIPAPAALAVTGFDPIALDSEDRLDEFDAAVAIRRSLRGSGAGRRIFVTFNGTKFDDEILRTLFFRNLMDPWFTSGFGSSRVDALAMVRFVDAVAPGRVAHIMREDGSRNWTLESLCQANGIPIAAHDAVSDTQATLRLCAFLRAVSPLAWQRAVACGNGGMVKALLSRHAGSREPVCMFTHFSEGDLAPLLVVGENGSGKWLAVDLRVDPSVIPDQFDNILSYAYAKNAPFRIIKASGAPLLMSVEDAATTPLAIDPSVVSMGLERWQAKAACMAFALKELRSQTHPQAADSSSEEGIYNGFVSFKDKAQMAAFHSTADWNARAAIKFTDPRLADFAARIVIRNHPGLPEDVEGDLYAKCRSALGRPYGAADARWPTLEKYIAEAPERWLAWAEERYAITAPPPTP